MGQYSWSNLFLFVFLILTKLFTLNFIKKIWNLLRTHLIWAYFSPIFSSVCTQVSQLVCTLLILGPPSMAAVAHFLRHLHHKQPHKINRQTKGKHRQPHTRSQNTHTCTQHSYLLRAFVLRLADPAYPHFPLRPLFPPSFSVVDKLFISILIPFE